MDVIDGTPSTGPSLDSTWSSFQEHVKDIIHRLQSASDFDESNEPIDLSFLFGEDDDLDESYDPVGDGIYRCPIAGLSESVEYHDDETLLEDFQTLLSDPLPNDPSIVTSDGLRLPLPSQVLCARSRYFHTMLSSRWVPSSGNCLEKPDASSAVFSDLLEYLATGAVTLPGKPHHSAQNVDLLVLANHLLLPSLECTVATHISCTLTLISFQSYISVCTFPSQGITDHSALPTTIVPESLEYVLSSYAVNHLEELCESLPRTWQYTRPFWYLLSKISMSCDRTEHGGARLDEHSPLPFPQSKLCPFFNYILKVAASFPLTSALARESPSTRAVLTNLLVYVQSEDLISRFRSLGLYPLEKHRCSTCTCLSPARKRFRFDYQMQGFTADLIFSNIQYFESEHPHTSYSDVFTSLQRVNVPQIGRGTSMHLVAGGQPLSRLSNSFIQSILLGNNGLERFDKPECDSISMIILFDRFSSLGPNARLVFYRDDPICQALEAEFCTDCVSVENVPPRYIALPTTCFWFAFVSNTPAEHPPVHNWWGWRFAVVPALKQHVEALEALFG